jgi:hypothetical protein
MTEPLRNVCRRQRVPLLDRLVTDEAGGVGMRQEHSGESGSGG